MTRTLQFPPSCFRPRSSRLRAAAAVVEAVAVLRRRPSLVRVPAVARAAGRSPAARPARSTSCPCGAAASRRPSRRSWTPSRRRPAWRAKYEAEPRQTTRRPADADHRRQPAGRRDHAGHRLPAPLRQGRLDQEDLRPRASTPRPSSRTTRRASSASGTVDGELYAIMVKFNSKSTFWYPPRQVSRPPASTRPKTGTTSRRCSRRPTDKGDKPLGLGAKDDWTLTDWFESIYIRQAGLDAYDKLFSKDGDWTDPSVTKAVETMTEVLNDKNVVGGIKAALGRGFVDGIAQVFRADPEGRHVLRGRLRRRHHHRPGQQGGQARRDDRLVRLPDHRQHEGVTIGGDVIAAFTTKAGRQGVHGVHDHRRGRHGLGRHRRDHLAGQGRRRRRVPQRPAKREAPGRQRDAPSASTAPTCCPAAAAADLGAELQKAIQGQTVDWADFQTRDQDRLGQRVTRTSSHDLRRGRAIGPSASSFLKGIAVAVVTRVDRPGARHGRPRRHAPETARRREPERPGRLPVPRPGAAAAAHLPRSTRRSTRSS